MQPRPTFKQPTINVRLPPPIRHIPQHIQHHRDVRPAKRIPRRVEVKLDGPARLVKFLEGVAAAARAGFFPEDADACEDGHFRSGVRGRGWGFALEDLNGDVEG